MQNFNLLKEEMQKAARRAYDIRLQSGDGGNLSVRVPEEDIILIKASGCSFGNMSNEYIVAVDFKGNIIEGKHSPSRELLTHIEIYKKRKDVNAIFHCHSPWAVSAAMYLDEIPFISLPLDMKIGRVPVLDAGENHANDKIPPIVRNFLDKNPGIKCFIQRQHGIFCMANSIIKAEHDAELVEEASQIAVLTNILKNCKK